MSGKSDHLCKSELSSVCHSASGTTFSWATGMRVQRGTPSTPKCWCNASAIDMVEVKKSAIFTYGYGHQTDHSAMEPGHGCCRQGKKPEPPGIACAVLRVAGHCRDPAAETLLMVFWVVLHFNGSFASLCPAARVLPSSGLQNTGAIWVKRTWVSPYKWPTDDTWLLNERGIITLFVCP